MIKCFKNATLINFFHYKQYKHEFLYLFLCIAKFNIRNFQYLNIFSKYCFLYHKKILLSSNRSAVRDIKNITNNFFIKTNVPLRYVYSKFFIFTIYNYTVQKTYIKNNYNFIYKKFFLVYINFFKNYKYFCDYIVFNNIILNNFFSLYILYFLNNFKNIIFSTNFKLKFSFNLRNLRTTKSSNLLLNNLELI